MDPRRLRPDIPRGLATLVLACLSKRPAFRPADGAALRDDLDRVLRGERPRARPRRRLAPPLLAATGAVAALAIARAWTARTGEQPPPGGAGAPHATPSRVAALEARARSLRASDPGAASRLLGDALADAPDRHDLRLERGLLLWAAGDAAGARAEWGRIPEGAAHAPFARLYRALETFFRVEGGVLQGQAALSDLEAVAREGGAPARLAQAAIAALAQDYPRVQALLRGEPGWEAALLRGHTEGLDPRGDPAAALRDLDRAIREGIPFYWVYNERGVARQKNGDHAGAAADFTTALERQPRYAPALTNRAHARLKLNDLEGASRDVDLAAALAPRSYHVLVNRGMVRFERGDSRGAIADFTSALEIHPGSAAPLLNRVIARRRLGDLPGAEEDATAAVRLEPGNAEALFQRGLCRYHRGDSAGALEDLTAAVALRPEFSDAFYNRGNLHRERGDLDAAAEDFRAALRLEPEMASAHANLGVVMAQRGDWAGAADEARAFLRIAPGDPWAAEARRMLARAEEELAAGRERGR
ncbi:MAG: tetratricopeptide repeat protein [Planctomycetales bacterium]|nr:tetratricopeptide repeat protein [Planctomycetales bacterium]